MPVAYQHSNRDKMKVIAALALTAMLSSSVAASDRGLGAPHTRLIATLESKGVTVRIMPRGAAGTCSQAWGSYSPGMREVIICIQGNQFDEGSLDTIRHEAIHVAQDCRAFRLGDGAMKAGLSLDASYKRGLSVGVDLDKALAPYVLRGFGPKVLTIEAEAISGAAVLTADQIADQIKEVCS